MCICGMSVESTSSPFTHSSPVPPNSIVIAPPPRQGRARGASQQSHGRCPRPQQARGHDEPRVEALPARGLLAGGAGAGAGCMETCPRGREPPRASRGAGARGGSMAATPARCSRRGPERGRCGRLLSRSVKPRCAGLPGRTRGQRVGSRRRSGERLGRVDPMNSRRGHLLNGNPSGDPSTAPRCGARTRSGRACLAPAIRGKRRCRMHGGRSTGPRTPEGLARSRRARWKHGRFSEETRRERAAAVLAVPAGTPITLGTRFVVRVERVFEPFNTMKSRKSTFVQEIPHRYELILVDLSFHRGPPCLGSALVC